VCDEFDASFLNKVKGVDVQMINGCINIVIGDVNTMQQIIDMIINKGAGVSSGTRFY
jgi:hypothetical protein